MTRLFRYLTLTAFLAGAPAAWAATATVSQAVSGSLDTAVAGATMNGLTNGSYAIGAAIDNRPTTGSVVSYDMADFTMTLSSAITAGTGNPNITIWIIPAIDGTNYASTTGASGTAAANAAPNLSYGCPMVASGANIATIVCPNIPIPPTLFKVMIQNNSGVTFPATNTSTAQILRKTVASW